MIQRFSAYICALLPVLALIGGVVTGDMLWAFWLAFPVLPALALSSAVFSRVRFDYAVLIVAVLALVEGVGDPLSVVGGMINEAAGLGAFPRATGLAAFALLSALSASLLALREWSFARIVTATAIWGLLVVVTAFHLVVVNLPFQAARQDLAAHVDSVFEQPCAQGCIRGGAEDVLGFGDSERLDYTVRDIQTLPAVQFCWIESDILLDAPAVDICVRKGEDFYEVRRSVSGIDPYIASMRWGFAFLSLLFMSAWGLGGVYVLMRHGHMVRVKGRWKKM